MLSFGYKTRIHSGYKSQKGKNIPEHFDSDGSPFQKNTKITDRKLLMCAVYVFRSLYLNFGHGTHHIYIILHVAVFNSLLQFEIAMFDFPLQFFTCARICTSKFLRHTTISLIKSFFKDIRLHSSIYFMCLAKFSAFFRLFHQFTIGFKKCPTYFSILPLVLNRLS